MKLPPVSGKEMVKILSLKDFQIVRQRSSHVQMKNEKGVLVTVSVHSGKDVAAGIVLKILRDAEISREEFILDSLKSKHSTYLLDDGIIGGMLDVRTTVIIQVAS